MGKITILLVTFLLCNTTLVLAQNLYIREGSIGKPKKQHKQEIPLEEFLSFRPIKKCVGEKFLFLPKHKSLQKYGYQSFYSGAESVSSFRKNPSYKECVGKIGTVIKVSDNYFSKIILRIDDNGQIYRCSGDDSIYGIAPLRDIDYARNKLLGKILWCSYNSITTFDATTGEIGV